MCEPRVVLIVYTKHDTDGSCLLVLLFLIRATKCMYTVGTEML
jgi:hypothetical protein